MWGRFKNMSIILKVLVLVCAIAIFPITLLAFSIEFVVKSFKRNERFKVVFGVFLVFITFSFVCIWYLLEDNITTSNSSNKKQEKISNMIETLYEVWCTYKRSDEMDCKVCKEYKAWISYASLFFKKQCFSAEEEMRFVATIRKNELNNLFYELDNGKKIKMYAFRNVGGVITPYIKMPLFGWSDETSWVTSNVVVGPCMDYSQKKDGILRFVDSLDYKFHDLHVKESEIPVRY